MTTTTGVLDLTARGKAKMPKGRFANAKSWTRETISPKDWTIKVSRAAEKEMHGIVGDLRRQGMPTFMLDPAYFEVDACRTMMAKARAKLDKGHGMAVIDKLPLDDWSEDEARSVYFVLAKLVTQPVLQSASGMVFREIRNEKPQGSNGATNDQLLAFHTDNSGNRNTPNYVSLLALYGAKEGGLSMYCSLYSLYNAMAEEAPAQLERLFQPYYHDRQGIQSPGEAEIISAPAIGYNGKRLSGRFSKNKIPSGYKKAGEVMDNLTRDSLDTVMDVIDKRDLAAKYMVGRGQLLIFNNREGLHHREPFKNGPTVEEQRHLVRMWYRHEGRPFFDG